MVTAKQVFEITMDLIDERLDSGLISESDTKSYEVKTPGLLTILQAELVKQGDIYSTFDISNKPVENILGFSSNFDIQEFEGNELTFEANKPARSYYFEVDGPGTVYIEDYTAGWNTLKTIAIPDTVKSFTPYKGVVTPTVGATRSRIRFAGTFYYRTVNRALFSIPFQEERVPTYRPWVKKQMPDDFKSVDEIINEYPSRQYAKDASYKWEGKRDLYINYYYNGNIRVVYRPVPSSILAITDQMQVDDVTAKTIVPYGLAAHLLLTENPDSANYFQQRFEELKRLASQQQTASEEMITNLYGNFG
jgi:hypothetical protein